MTVAHILGVKGNAVIHVPPELRVVDAIALLSGKRIGAVVVSADGRSILGILSERDVVHVLAGRGAAALDVPVGEVMTKDVVTCRQGDSVDEVMERMTRNRFRHLPVVTADNVMCGMISIGDVVKARLDEIQSEAETLRDYITQS